MAPPDDWNPDRQPEPALAPPLDTLRAGKVHPWVAAPRTVAATRLRLFVAGRLARSMLRPQSRGRRSHHLRGAHDPLLRIRPLRDQVPAGAVPRADCLTGPRDSGCGAPFRRQTPARKSGYCIHRFAVGQAQGRRATRTAWRRARGPSSDASGAPPAASCPSGPAHAHC
jgi:hypothetical protein